MNIFVALAGVKKEKDLAYADAGTSNLLDIYHSDQFSKPQDVIVFIHGGSWNSGSKDTYWFLGRNFARKGKIVVVINYQLSPEVQYDAMAYDCAKAVKWVKNHIQEYGGNPNQIFVMGHSAGGHLAALINQNPKYFNQAGIQNPIKGVILNDPFGLNIYQYMKLQINTDDKYIPGFLKVFGADEEEWKNASPIFTVDQIQNPYQLFSGSKTYPSIQMQTPAFYKALKENHKSVSFEIINGKKHIGMITQMIFGCNKMYDKIIDFIDKH
ncbi:MAG: alpha/beta hydrolase [Bacteroidetes bacterium]|nr:alpha/beta hydrolase [Bacteroidota bacterium]MBU1484020.1 alpha/beta hydrolase [Bacteroidota bacterium]MBU2268777.1 alpha/beta hydrolase [Bacteroidota bacterium]MBU2377378.1 alpha/beta hydrolase [Bacteroidota bacterium]